MSQKDSNTIFLKNKIDSLEPSFIVEPIMVLSAKEKIQHPYTITNIIKTYFNLKLKYIHVNLIIK